MTNQRSNRRRPFPPYDESSALSRRDQTLARVEKLLSEQFIVAPQDDLPSQEDEPMDLVDLEEAVETATLPREARPLPRALPPRATSMAQGQAQVPALPEEPLEKKIRLSAFSAILQGAILIFVLAWVFLLGILVGRGHLWQTGLGHELVVWVEQKAGWANKARPEIVLKKDNQPDEVIKAATEQDLSEIDHGAGTMAGLDQTADGPELPDSGIPDKEPDEMPVWNWPGWSPGAPDNPLGEPRPAKADQPAAQETTPPPRGNSDDAS